MEDFTLVLRELINKDVEKIKIDLPETAKLEFEKTAENFLNKDLTLEAIKVFALTKNMKRLDEIGFDCIKNAKPGLSFKAFYFSGNKEGLNKTGEEFLKQGEIENALSSFRLAENNEMVEFLVKNF